MKRFLLLISLMLVMTGMIAQDVYTVGQYTPSGQSQTHAAVYKNGTLLHNSAYVGTSDNTSTAVIVSPSSMSDVFWTHCTEHPYGDVYKNSSLFLNNANGYIHDMYWGGYSQENICSAGYRMSDGKKYAAVWKGNNSSPIYSPGFANGYESEAFGVISVRDYGSEYFVYYCGYEQATEGGGSPRATVWKNSSVLYTLSVFNSCAYDIACYNDYIYTVGTEIINGAKTLKVWRNNSVLYTLVDSNAAERAKIYIEAGDIYVVSYGGSSPDIVWKNGQQLYTTGSYFYSVAVNSNGVYCAGKANSTGTVWKDGQVLYTITGSKVLNDICLGPEVSDGEIHSLPFNESFETGSTEWANWTKIDIDNTNVGYASYWDRCGERMIDAASGDYCAAHLYGPSGSSQRGWLISPRLYLQPGRDYTTLQFKSYEGSTGTTSMKVMVSTSSNIGNTSNYSEVYSITNQSADWKTISVDLSAYQGEAVYIAFKYEGMYAKNWYIDDVSVTEGWEVPSAYNVPYTMSFDQNNHQEPGYCWYIIDNDHSGEVKNWKWSSSENCAYHPWGQQNMPQEGWMFSPSVTLPSGHNYQLSFLTKNTSSGAGMNSSVWIALDENGTPDPAHYTTKLWEESTASSWHSVNIDLTEYAGHEVRIAFKYEGTYAHAWYVDDFAIEQNTIQYNINVVANNASWGTVTGGGTYDQGADVTITAEPNSGYDFLKWTKDGAEVSTNATYSFTATENATYTAVFGEQSVTYYTITTAASPADAGTVEGGGTYEDGATVILAASANPGWQFVQWTDGNADNPRNITVTGDATYTAQFSQINYVINVDAVPYEGGSVTGGGTYHYGDAVTLTATPNEGYDFLQWDNGETALTRTVIVDGDANYAAYFAEHGTNTYEIAVFTNDPELGTVSGGGVYPEGTVITISATPIGYASFVRWDDGDTNATRTITVTADASYTAIFEMGALYTITVESLNPTMGSVAGGGEFPAGAEIMIQATPFGGYHFDGWDDNVYENPRMVTVTGNATYKARFSEQQQETYHITVLCNDPNAGTVYGTGDYPAGATATIVAVPNSGYRFKEWNDGVKDQYRTITVTANATYFATFEGDGVDEYGIQTISLYPNPANDVIRLEGIGENTEVRIYNAIGALVKAVNVSDDEEIFVSDLKAGLYIIRSGNTMLKFTKK